MNLALNLVFKVKTNNKLNTFTLNFKEEKMKKIALITFSFMAATMTFAQQAETKAPAASVVAPKPVKDINKYFEFTNTDWNFGKIAQGKPVEYDVLVKNISKDTAVLDNVQVSCGCTTPKYNKGQKIAPGATYKVTLGFNAGVLGAFSKSITFYLNKSEFTKVVTFHGETFAAPAAPAPANNATNNIKPAGE